MEIILAVEFELLYIDKLVHRQKLIKLSNRKAAASYIFPLLVQSNY